MAKAEKRFSSKGQDVQKFSRRIADAGEYDAKLKTEKAAIRIGQQETSMPRVGVGLEILGTEGDSGKNVFCYADLFTSLKPGSDGITMPMRSHGVVALARSLGEEVDLSIVQHKGQDCLNAKELLQWVKNRHDEVIRVRLKVEKDLAGNPVNRVDEFIESDVQRADVSADDDADYDEDDGVEDGEYEEDDEDDLPPPPPRRKKK